VKEVPAGIFIQDKHVLLARRAPGEKLAGFWEYPGGKRKHNESLSQCLERELYEEFGVTITAHQELVRSLYTYEHGCFEIIAIKATGDMSNIQLRVHDKIEWVIYTELLTYNLLPADIPISQYIQEHIDEL
jgi:8-oxo-dGTP diphosphatase